MVRNMICKVSSNCTYLFCTYLELDIEIDVVICCVELVAIVFKFCTCKLLDVKLVAIVLIFHVNT